MLSARFVSFVYMSFAALAAVNASPTNATGPGAATSMVTDSHDEVPSTTIEACYYINYKYCATITVVQTGCQTLPGFLVKELASIRIPHRWSCRLYNANNCENNDYSLFTTWVNSPGTADLSDRDFKNWARSFYCEYTPSHCQGNGCAP
ncbi:hypothetical protein B0H16DRAFT_1533335 [Mycena metata]|uniref:Uncharacterized protein n=1 Tax=Mycena metata TaxID=1033252 RepID=A0AAD7J980_9AGAR|nr:hypothetical protein B0H16DRAFT_1533335 [Mycena metata]